MKNLSTHAVLAALVATTTASTSQEYSLANFDPKKLSVVGCYSELNDNLNNWHTWEKNSAQLCSENCIKHYNSSVIALNGGSCFCGSDQIPPKTKLIDDKFCKFKCYSAVDAADAAIPCGGEELADYVEYPNIPVKKNTYTVVKTGLKEEVTEGHLSESEAEYLEWSAAQSSSSVSSSAPASTGVAGLTGTGVSTPGAANASPTSASTSAVSGTPSASVPTGSASVDNARIGMVAIFGLAAYIMA